MTTSPRSWNKKIVETSEPVQIDSWEPLEKELFPYKAMVLTMIKMAIEDLRGGRKRRENAINFLRSKDVYIWIDIVGIKVSKNLMRRRIEEKIAL